MHFTLVTHINYKIFSCNKQTEWENNKKNELEVSSREVNKQRDEMSNEKIKMEQDKQNISDEIMAENFLNLKKETDIQEQEP